VQPSHADINQALYRMTECLSHHGSFFGNREITCARRNHQNRSALSGRRASGWRRQMNGAGQRIPDQSREARLEQPGHFNAGSSSQKTAVGRLQPLTDRDHLFGSLSLAEDDLGVAQSQGPVVVHPCEREVFEGEMPQSFNCGAGE
jgi:hypothetical protein